MKSQKGEAMKNKLGISLCTFSVSATGFFMTEVFTAISWAKEFKQPFIYGLIVASIVAAFISFLLDRK